MGKYRTIEGYPHFCTITVLDWIPVFIDDRFILPLIESLRYSQRNKDFLLHGFVVMPNHLHLVATSENLDAVIRDFKRFTSNNIHKLLKDDSRESLLRWLEYAADRARKNCGEFSFWQHGFHPQAISSEEMMRQKLEYLHANPVRKGLVTNPEDWVYSSARFYEGAGDCCLEMDALEW